MPSPNNKRHARRVMNNAEVAGRLDPDWLLRWDASTSEGIGYLTDAATNDVDSWESQEGPEALGTLLLEDTGVASNYPEWVQDADGFSAVHLQNDGGLWNANISTSNADLAARIDDAVDVTVFIVSMLNNPTAKSSNSYFLHGPQGARYANVGADESIDLFLNGGFRSSGNGWEDRRQICSHRNKHNGTNDNDLEGFIGKDSLYSVAALGDSSVAGPNSITFGSYSDASTALWDMDVNIYEVLIYGKALTDAEHSDVVDFLSAKWQATNDNAASDTITASTEEQWVSRGQDPYGEGATGSPMRHSIAILPDPDFPLAGSTNIADPHYGITRLAARAAVTNGVLYFSAEDTGLMTQATPGYVSAQTNAITGGLGWSGTGTNGGPALHEVVNGHNYYQLEAVNQGLTINATIRPDASTSDAWGYVVVRHPDLISFTAQARMLTIDYHKFAYVGGYNAWGVTDQPMYYSYNDPTSASPQLRMAMEGGNTGNVNPSVTTDETGDAVDPGRLYVITWRWDDSAHTLNYWHNGMWLCERYTGTGTYGHLYNALASSVGATAVGASGMLDMKFYEAGIWIGTAANTITDAEMEDLQNHLCNKFDIDVMPDNTPFMLGKGLIYNHTIRQQDCVWWFRTGDGATIDSWKTDNLLLQNTTRFDCNSTDGVGAPTLEYDKYGRQAMLFDSLSGLHDATTYTWSEGTVNDAPKGYSSFVIAELTDAATPVSNGYACDTTGIQTRRNGTTDKWDCRVAGATMTSVSSYESTLVCIIGTYDFTEQTARAYINEETLSDSSPTVSTLGAATISIGQDSAGANNGDVRVLECAAWKHKLDQRDIDNLLKYARQRYKAPFT